MLEKVLVECDINTAEWLIEARWRISLSLTVGRCGRQLRLTHTLHALALCLALSAVASFSLIFMETK